ncbi:hypothetical protein D3C77_396800 [compost metagenome]
MEHAAEQGCLIYVSLNIVFGFINDFDRLGVAGFGCISPSNQPMLLHEHQLRLRIIEYALGNHFG